MDLMHTQTKSLILTPLTREEVRAQVDQMDARDKKELSPAWLALLEGSAEADPWIHGFRLVRRIDHCVVGTCGFKGPPGADGTIEIAYGIAPEHRGKGYATEAATALVTYAFAIGSVRLVRAHTLPKPNASTRVLGKCGFKFVGEVIDPDDGLVWRWETSSPSPVA